MHNIFFLSLLFNKAHINSWDIFIENLYIKDFFFSKSWVLDLLPELSLLAFICYNLISVFNSNSDSTTKATLQFYRWVFFLSVVLVFLIIQLFVIKTSGVQVLFGFSWINCYYTVGTKILLTSLILIVFLISYAKWQNNILFVTATVELPLIVGFSTLFIYILTSSYDFFGMYLAIEGLSLTLYTLAALLYEGTVAVEAAIKYFSLGAISTGILLFGISILFSIVGSLDFLEVQVYLTSDKTIENITEIKFAFICILFGFFFKIGAFPCHIWVADVYEGIWTPITAFFAIVIKATIILFFLRLIFNVMFNFIFVFQPIFIFVALGSMLIGSLGALKQVRIKRFIAYTSINQVGFLFLGIASCNLAGLTAVIMFMVIYVAMSIIFFAVLLNTEQIVTKRGLMYLSDLYDISRYNITSGKCLALTILSMAGLPPLGGFIGKLFLYFAATEARLDMSILISMLIGVISTYYYLSLVRHIWFEKGKVIKLYMFNSNNLVELIIISLCLFLGLFLFLLPSVWHQAELLALSCTWPYIFG